MRHGEPDDHHHLPISGRYSPLRYPGGKGKLAKFIRSIIVNNDLADGLYIEPYAGGAAVAWELLLTGVVRKVVINDINLPIFAFWTTVLDDTEALCRRIHDCRVTLRTWDKCKNIMRNQNDNEFADLAFSFFFLNRTNRSGIMNGGVIGGRYQTGAWKIDARFNKAALISRIEKIATARNRIEVWQCDAVQFIRENRASWGAKSFLYIDPPYYEKGRHLYDDFYDHQDHNEIAEVVCSMPSLKWMVSYDDVRPIHLLYEDAAWIQYSLNYSARNKERGREALFFSSNLDVPPLEEPLIERRRGDGLSGAAPIPVHRRRFPKKPAEIVRPYVHS